MDIYQILLRLNIECGKIYIKIINHLSSEYTSKNNIELSNNDIKCYFFGFNEKKIFFLFIMIYLKNKKLSYLKENSIHNGFEYVDYIIIQIFSKYNFGDKSLIEYLNIYNANPG